MKIVVAGGTGALGKHLIDRLEEKHEIIILSRNNNQKISQNISVVNYSKDLHLWAETLKDSDVIINLVGEPIANKRWSERQKKNILNSRLKSIQKISDALKMIKHNPKIIMNASAVGYYENSLNRVNETFSSGNDFLSNICVQWEKKAKDEFKDKTQQLILLRLGVVLDSNSGILSKLIPIFKLYLGAVIGSGSQYFPWIHINDVSGIIKYLINSKIKGPVNLVSPKIDNNLKFSKKLGKTLNRRVFISIPEFFIKFLLGEMSIVILKSSNVTPQVILDSNYQFEFENLDKALNNLLS